MPVNPVVIRRYLAGTVLVVSVTSICYLALARSQAYSSPSDLTSKVEGIETTLRTLKQEQQAIKEDVRLLWTALEDAGRSRSEQEGNTAAYSSAQPALPASTPRLGPGAIEAARKNWIAAEYPRILERSQANAASMVAVLGSDTSIQKDKLAPMKDIFSEASIRIANAIAEADDMNDVKAINSKISEINQWKDGALSALLSKEEFEQYKSINWTRKLPGPDKSGGKQP
jgi:hypothetical protein